MNWNNTIFYRAKNNKICWRIWVFIICEIFPNKYRKQLLHTGLDALKTPSKKVVHKTAEATGEFLGNKIVNKIVKTKTCNWWKPKKCWRNNYSAIKKRSNIKRIKTSIIKMEHYKISKLLNDSTLSRFLTKKSIEINDLSSDQYSVSKNIEFKTSMLRTNLCHFSDEYIVVKEKISVRGTNDAKKRNEMLTFKNDARFKSCISKINHT